jgi:hypothetical protein
MERKIELGTVGHPSHGQGMADRRQHSPPLLRLEIIPEASEQVPAWMAADLVGRDAPISVWWDYPP